MNYNFHSIASSGTRNEILSIVEEIKVNISDSDELQLQLQRILNLRNEQKYSPLHTSIFSRNLEVFSTLIEFGSDVNSKCHGTPPLHLSIVTATLPSGYEFGLTCALKLIAEGCDLTAKDDQGLTALHLASKFNLCPIVDNIIRSSNSNHDVNSSTNTNLFGDDDEQRNSFQELINMKDRRGFRAIHFAAQTDAINAAKLLIPISDLLLTNLYHQTSLHLAAYYNSHHVWKGIISYANSKNLLDKLIHEQDIFGRNPIEAAIFSGNNSLLVDLPSTYLENYSSFLPLTSQTQLNVTIGQKDNKLIQTAIISHPYCRLHHTCPPSAVDHPSAPPENIKRLSVLLDHENGILRSSDIESNTLFVEECRAAAISDILRVHEWSYVRKIQSTCEDVAAVFGKSLTTIGGEDEEAEHNVGIVHLDSDTAISKRSFDAALRAAGSLCQAVDMIVNKQVRNAFCAVRPPGHHAGPSGLMSGPDAGAGAESHGFCLLNNISIGAAYAMNVHRHLIKKVAIVDFDVHHGNGTEETIKWLNPSITTHDIVSPNIFGQIHTPRYKPWYDIDDAKNVLFISVHGYGPRERGLERFLPAAAFYPGTGKTIIPNENNNNNNNNILNSNNSNINKSSNNSNKIEKIEVRNQINNIENGDEDDNDHGDDDEINNNTGNKQDDGEDDDDEDDEDYEEGEDNDNDNDNDDDDNDMNEGEVENDNENDENENDSSFNGLDNEDDEGEIEQYSDSSEINIPLKSNLLSPYAKLMKSHSYKQNDYHSQTIYPPLVLDIGVNLADEEMVQGEYRHQWRNYFRDIIFPKLMSFKPDCIFISAGFDAHKKDLINSGYISLVEEDYEWVTENLMRIANTVCDGRIVSALEGGYQLGGEFCSSFAKSVKAHVSTLCCPALNTSKYIYDPIEMEKEKQEEIKAINTIKEKKEQKRLDAEKKAGEWRLLKHQQEQEYMQIVFNNNNTNATDNNDSNNNNNNNNTIEQPIVNGQNNLLSNMVDEVNQLREAVSEADGRNKRRRTTKVDYVALNKEIFLSTSTNLTKHLDD